jgi:hypothetical protein
MRSDQSLVSVSTGDGILPQRWLELACQPEWTRTVARLRDVEKKIAQAQQRGQQGNVDRLQADRVEAESHLVCITERLHQELKELLQPSLALFVRGALNQLEALIRWQGFIATSRFAVLNSGFSPTALPYRVSVEAIVNCDLRPALTLLAGQAQSDGLISNAEALALLSGQQIDSGTIQSDASN